MTLVVVLAFVVAVGAAMRSTWSPCGWSMLSTLTPLSERARGNRFAVTGMWFVLGATVGGAALGLLGAADRGHGIGPSTSPLHGRTPCSPSVRPPRWGSSSTGLAGSTVLPHHRRQVNEQWLDELRSWVYGTGFGVQIGFGLATYIMTAAVYLTVLLGGLTASPWLAVAVGTTFGFVARHSRCSRAHGATPPRSSPPSTAGSSR